MCRRNGGGRGINSCLPCFGARRSAVAVAKPPVLTVTLLFLPHHPTDDRIEYKATPPSTRAPSPRQSGPCGLTLVPSPRRRSAAFSIRAHASHRFEPRPRPLTPGVDLALARAPLVCSSGPQPPEVSRVGRTGRARAELTHSRSDAALVPLSLPPDSSRDAPRWLPVHRHRSSQRLVLDPRFLGDQKTRPPRPEKDSTPHPPDTTSPRRTMPAEH